MCTHTHTHRAHFHHCTQLNFFSRKRKNCVHFLRPLAINFGISSSQQLVGHSLTLAEEQGKEKLPEKTTKIHNHGGDDDRGFIFHDCISGNSGWNSVGTAIITVTVKGERERVRDSAESFSEHIQREREQAWPFSLPLSSEQKGKETVGTLFPLSVAALLAQAMALPVPTSLLLLLRCRGLKLLTQLILFTTTSTDTKSSSSTLTKLTAKLTAKTLTLTLSLSFFHLSLCA